MKMEPIYTITASLCAYNAVKSHSKDNYEASIGWLVGFIGQTSLLLQVAGEEKSENFILHRRSEPNKFYKGGKWTSTASKFLKSEAIELARKESEKFPIDILISEINPNSNKIKKTYSLQTK
jgi:hypothetical protein